MKKTRLMLSFILLSVFLSVMHAQVYDDRTGIIICFNATNETFPESWKTPEINAKGLSLPQNEIEPYLQIITKVLANYPTTLIQNNLKAIHILKSIEIYGSQYKGTSSSNQIYISTNEIEKASVDKMIENTFHSEFSYILLKNHPNDFNKNEWLSKNGLPYGRNNSLQLEEISDNKKFESTLKSNGFLNELSVWNFDNDFNSFVENLFFPDDDFHEAIHNHNKIKEKYDLIVGFYTKLDTVMNFTFFETKNKDQYIKNKEIQSEAFQMGEFAELNGQELEDYEGSSLDASSENLNAHIKGSLNKEKTIALYTKLYESSELSYMPWKGNAEDCDGGSLRKDVYTKAENRINFFRILLGLSPVKNNERLNLPAQAAALLAKANNALTHYPTEEMKCYSELARKGSLSSCLGFSDYKNFQSTAFITGLIDDYGEENFAVGHRRWLLYTQLAEFGYGATDVSEAVLTADGIANELLPVPAFFSYPWPGYVPVHLIFPKWSFSIPENMNVDFSDARITMTKQNGENIKIEKLQERKNYLDHTIVWLAHGLFSEEDIAYGKNRLEELGHLNIPIKVSISNVKVNGKIKNYHYWVEPFKL